MVGGLNVIYLLGGGGGGGLIGLLFVLYDGMFYCFVILGYGWYFKVVEVVVDWFCEILVKIKWGEGLEGWLKECFEGGGLYGFWWKEFWGFEWEWFLGEVVGFGVVEFFDMLSVGRGVRVLGS